MSGWCQAATVQLPGEQQLEGRKVDDGAILVGSCCLKAVELQSILLGRLGRSTRCPKLVEFRRLDPGRPVLAHQAAIHRSQCGT